MQRDADPTEALRRHPDWDALRRELPEYPLDQPRYLGEGWMSTAYGIAGSLVIKFPKRESTWPDLEREIGFLEATASRLPVATPRHLRRMRRSSASPHGWALLEGVPGASRSPASLSTSELDALAGELAAFLRALHELPSAQLTGLPAAGDARQTAEELQRLFDRLVAPALGAAEREKIAAILTDHVDDTANFAVFPCLIHADLSADHIMMKGGSVTGIIDWGDVCVGDRDYDFGYLYQDYGPGFVRRVAERYGHPDPERLLAKARYYTICDQIGTIADGSMALPGDLEESWRRLRRLA